MRSMVRRAGPQPWAASCWTERLSRIAMALGSHVTRNRYSGMAV
ncbi:MAG: hypothetical protein U1E21_09755 [Reyranellaceae bacterium]